MNSFVVLVPALTETIAHLVRVDEVIDDVYCGYTLTPPDGSGYPPGEYVEFYKGDFDFLEFDQETSNLIMEKIG